MRRLLLVCASLLLPAAVLCAQAENQEKFKVTGSVVNTASGEPVRGALVEFQGREARSVKAGMDGHFEIDGLVGGASYVSARRPGFAPPNQQQRITIGSSTDAVVIKLVPLAKISGRVVDREGEPIEGVMMQCFHQAIVNGRKQWQPANGAGTDETGNFSIEDLAPGAYILGTHKTQLYMTRAKSEAARYIYPSTFYPDAPTRDLAQRIEVAPGEEMKVDMALQSIRGARVSFTTVPRSPNVMGTISQDDDNFNFQNGGAQTDASGVLTFGAVPPGSWKIVVRGPFSGPRKGGEEPLYGELPLEVGTADIENLKVPLGKLADIPVVVSGTTRSQVFVQLFSKAGTPVGGLGPDEGGELKIRSVAPGTYRVVVPPNGGNNCITSVMSGSQDLQKEELVVSPGASIPPIQIVQSDKCQQLTINSGINGNVSVIITSDGKGFEPRLLTGVANGYTVSGLSEGEYKIYAFDEVTDLEYANPDAMRGFKSQDVKLEAGQTASVQVEVNERHAQ